MLDNFFRMPFPLRLITAVALFSPVIILLSVTGGGGMAVSGSAVLVLAALLISLPCLFSGIFMVRRKSRGRGLFLIGWLVVCMSPFLVNEIGVEIVISMAEFYFNIALGVVFMMYLAVDPSVGQFFRVG